MKTTVSLAAAGGVFALAMLTAVSAEVERPNVLFVAPGVTQAGGVCQRPVDFLGIHPTLADRCGLPIPEHVQGVSLRPLLVNVEADWEPTALTTHGRGEHDVRNERWRSLTKGRNARRARGAQRLTRPSSPANAG
jgi:arylsulfatase A-like enzyme